MPALPKLSVPVHPAANMLPMMSEAELCALADDIKSNGQRHPIVMLKGQILDGRNRWLACQIAGVKPSTVEWTAASSPVDFVVSANVLRRQLSKNQRALTAARAVPLFEAEARERQRGGRGGKKLRAAVPGASRSPGRARDRAAALFNIGARTVGHAMKVLRFGTPKLVLAIEAETVTVTRGAAIATAPRDEQLELLKCKPTRRKLPARTVPPAPAAPNPSPATPCYGTGAVRQALGTVLCFLDDVSGPPSTPDDHQIAELIFEIAGVARERGWLSSAHAERGAPDPPSTAILGSPSSESPTPPAPTSRSSRSGFVPKDPKILPPDVAEHFAQLARRSTAALKPKAPVPEGFEPVVEPTEESDLEDDAEETWTEECEGDTDSDQDATDLQE